MTRNSKRRTKRPLSTVDVTKASPRVESTGASIFAGASSTSVLGGEVSNSQRDQNKATIIINVGGSNSDSSRATSAVSQTRTSGLVGDPPDAGTSSASGEEQALGSSETSFEIESPPTEEDIALEEEPSNTIYERHMCLKKHGFPLWTPQPNMTLPLSYQRQGVSIGDVGIFTLDGGFDFLFNICLPAGHPSNPDELPEGFSHLDLKPADVCKSRAHSSHSYMSSPSVRKRGAMSFECSGSDGAILTMPQGAYHEDLRNIKKFRDYAFAYAESWYQYANGPCGREIGNAELHLVTGWDKTTSWGIATYSHRQSKHVEDNSTRLSFNVINEGGHLYPTFAWDQKEGDAEVKAGPEDEELMDPPEVHAVAPLRNQCTFVRSLTPAFGDDEWERLQSKVAVSEESQASLGWPPRNPFLSVLGPTNSLPSRIGSSRGHSRMGTSRLTDSLTPAQTPAAHPATFVVDMLLQKCPKAKVVVVHDSDWCSAIHDSDKDWMSTFQDLQHRIQEVFDIVEEENGTVYLQKKMGSSQQPSTSSYVSVNLEEENFALLGLSQPFDSLEISPSNVNDDSPDTSEAPRKSEASWNGTPYLSKSPFQVMSQQSKKGRLSNFDYMRLPHPIHPTNNPGLTLQPDGMETSSLWSKLDANDEAPSLNHALNPFAHNGRSIETQPRGDLFSGDIHSPPNTTTAYLETRDPNFARNSTIPELETSKENSLPRSIVPSPMSKPTDRQPHGLPNEIIQHAVSFLPLKSLIIARAVSKRWERLIPHAEISPTRCALFNFFLVLVSSPVFLQTRPWVLENLQPFDRQAFIDGLMEQHPYIPEAFRVWILEWPAKAVVGCVWPGLPNPYYMEGRRLNDVHHGMGGKNWLAPGCPIVRDIPLPNCASKIPALPVFSNIQASVWLLLDERDTLRGKVYTFAGGSDVWNDDSLTECDDVGADWIEWQQRAWNKIEARASASTTSSAVLAAEERSQRAGSLIY